MKLIQGYNANKSVGEATIAMEAWSISLVRSRGSEKAPDERARLEVASKDASKEIANVGIVTASGAAANMCSS